MDTKDTKYENFRKAIETAVFQALADGIPKVLIYGLFESFTGALHTDTTKSVMTDTMRREDGTDPTEN